MPRPIILAILEGWGMRREVEGNAIALAHKPNFDSIWRNFPRTTLNCSSIDVGLPPGMKGNTEAGYLTLGAGRVVESENIRISGMFEDGSAAGRRLLENAIQSVKRSGKRLHLLGLVSDGNVHSHDAHWLTLLELAVKGGLRGDQVLFHAILDGRDTAPRAGLTHIAKLMAEMVTLEVGAIATVIGRSYAMDRDERWDRTEQAYNLLVRKKGLLAQSPIDAVRKGYERGESDETMSPTLVLATNGLPYSAISDDDAVIHFNFTRSRSRQLVKALQDRDFSHFKRDEMRPRFLWLAGKETRTDETVFPPLAIRNSLLDVLSSKKIDALLGYAPHRDEHLEFYFGGYADLQRTNDVVLSPAEALTERLVARMREQKAPFALISLSEVEEAGHSGSMTEAVRAVESVDRCLGKLMHAVEEFEAELIVTSTHGNAEQMINPDTGAVYPSHTTNSVPFILVSDRAQKVELRDDGSLADVAPTVLSMLNLEVPDEMEGMDLRVRTTRKKRRVHPRHPHVHPEALAAIEAGLREEVDSARFYLLAAATARDKESRELCLRLAHDEEDHLRKLRERYERLTGIPLDIPMSPEVARNVPSIFDLSVTEILDAAIVAEAETYRMFQSLSRKADDPQASDILQELAEEEKDHVEELKRARTQAEQWGKYYKIPERLH